MMIFVDASAFIATIAGEREATKFADCIEAAVARLCSAVSVWETIAGLCRSYMFSVPAARSHVGRFLATGEFRFVPIQEREFDVAADAYAQYGKGRHPAALNMGDCFAYACARTNGAQLLFKGNDFARTDIEVAV